MSEVLQPGQGQQASMKKKHDQLPVLWELSMGGECKGVSQKESLICGSIFRKLRNPARNPLTNNADTFPRLEQESKKRLQEHEKDIP